VKALTCVSCGASLDAPSDQPEIRCSYCGTVNEPTTRRPPPPLADEAAPVRVPLRTLGLTFGAIMLVPALGALLGIGAAVYGVWTAFHVASAVSHPPSIPRLRALRADDLRSLHESGRKVLSVDGPSGGFNAVDPVDSLPWATAIARAWAADSRLDRIDASHVRPDGTVDASSGENTEVLYRFSSPSRVSSYWREADASGRRECECEFWVVAHQGQTFVQLITARPSQDKPSASPAVLSLRQVFARTRGRLGDKPFYNAYMIPSGGDGWVWYLSSLSGRDDIPRVRAADARVYPW
jgi:LSD1 subclass zinc finger protein